MRFFEKPYKAASRRAGTPELGVLLDSFLESEREANGELTAADLNHLNEDDMIWLYERFLGPAVDDMSEALYARFRPES